MSERDQELIKWAEDVQDTGPAPDVNAMFSELETRIAAEPWTAALRALSSPVRFAIAVAVALAVASLVGLFSQRPDLAHYPLEEMLTVCAVYAVVMVWTGLAALRPAHLPALSMTNLATRMAVALGTALLLAAIPVTQAAAASDVPLWKSSAGCLSYGVGTGLPVYLALRLLDREQRMSAWMAALSAAAVGNIALQLHCASGHVGHRMLGHATVGWMLLAMTALLAAVMARFARR